MRRQDRKGGKSVKMISVSELLLGGKQGSVLLGRLFKTQIRMIPLRGGNSYPSLVEVCFLGHYLPHFAMCME